MIPEENSLQADEKIRRINIYVGYGWHTNKTVRTDVSSNSLRTLLEKSAPKFVDKKPVAVEIHRMRASQAEPLLDGFKRCFKEADVLVFDIATINPLLELPPKGKKAQKSFSFSDGSYTGFDLNVLFGIGIPIGRDQKPFLFCPNALKPKLPSDLSGLCLTLYDLKFDGENVTRVLEDRSGFAAALRRDVKNALQKKYGAPAATPSSENPAA